jgi:hypothetical protein
LGAWRLTPSPSMKKNITDTCTADLTLDVCHYMHFVCTLSDSFVPSFDMMPA